LARKFDSYIEGFALRVAIPAAHEMVDVGTIAIPPLERDIAENAKQTRSLFETFMQQHGVPRGGSATSLSFEWLEDAPEGDHFVGSHGRLFDVIVLGRPARDLKGSRMTTLEAALFESGRPVLIAPPSPRAQIGTYPLIAWNCSTEHARTIALAMPILKQASRVVVLTVEGGAAVPGPTGQQVCHYLQLSGVPAKPLTVGLNGRLTGEAVLEHTNALGCDLCVGRAKDPNRLSQPVSGDMKN